MTPLLDKPMPGNSEAERVLLGVALLDQEVFEEALHRLTPADFFLDSHGEIFRAMASLREVGMELNPVTVCEELTRFGSLARVGGPAYVASLWDGVPRYSQVTSMVDMVLTKARQRRLIRIGQKIVNNGFDDELTLDEQIEEAERGLIDVGEDRGSSSWSPLAGVTHEYLAEAEKRGQSNRPVIDFATGFHELDYMTLGLERKTMVVVAARPGMGKTQFGLSLTRNMSESSLNIVDGRPPVISWFSMEMPKKQLAQRLVASVGGVDSRRLHMGQLNSEEWRRVWAAEEQIAQWRVHIDERVGLPIRTMREALRTLKRQEGQVDVVVVDYLQLGDGERKNNDTRATEVGNISKGLVQIAKDFDVCVVAVSQLNRAAEGRGDKRPSLNDLRESGQIEQDAYMVIGLYREEYYNPDTPDRGIAEAIILKQRNGPLGTVHLAYDGVRSRFSNLAREYKR